MKNITIINGHPNPESFNKAIVNAYAEGAIKSGAKVTFINISSLDFNPNLAHGYQKRTTLEPDLEEAWQKIQRADHLVWIHPVWWGGLPAITKGFIDRLFLPGKAFKYRENSIWWDKLLSGKTARIIFTMDQPKWYYRYVNKQPSLVALKKLTLEFCGVKPVKTTAFGPIRNSTSAKRALFLNKTHQLGIALK